MSTGMAAGRQTDPRGGLEGICMPDELESDIHATAEDVAADAEVLQTIEAEKTEVDPADPRALELAVHAVELARGIAAKTLMEHDLVVEAGQDPAAEPSG